MAEFVKTRKGWKKKHVSAYEKDKVKHNKSDNAKYDYGQCSECNRMSHLRLMTVRQHPFWYCGYCFKQAEIYCKKNKIPYKKYFLPEGWENKYGGVKTLYGEKQAKEIARKQNAANYYLKLKKRNAGKAYNKILARNPIPKAKKSRFVNAGFGKNRRRNLRRRK